MHVPLGGCDCYLLALDDHMQQAGQGRHVGVTVLELGPGFSPSQLAGAVKQFAAVHPLLGAHLRRGLPMSVPHWVPDSPAVVKVAEHSGKISAHALAESLLAGRWHGFLRFDVVRDADRTLVFMGWNHLLFDARGVELALTEIAGLAASNGSQPPVRGSWGVHAPPTTGFFKKLSAVRPFIDRYYEIKKPGIRSLSPAPAVPGKPECAFLHFTAEETAAMDRRARQATGGIFLMPYFLAVSMRAHAAVLESRGIKDGTLQCAIAVQGRRRGAADPVFQNQVTQLFFVLGMDEMATLHGAASALQDQFAAMTKRKTDVAFLTMVNWMRRLPLATYRRFLRRSADGNITSFYHAHTGDFMPRVSTFCGAPILNGWHVPSVSQPPGTGTFFSVRNGMLTMSFSWREGAVTLAELDLLLARIRSDLLGTGD